MSKESKVDLSTPSKCAAFEDKYGLRIRGELSAVNRYTTKDQVNYYSLDVYCKHGMLVNVRLPVDVTEPQLQTYRDLIDSEISLPLKVRVFGQSVTLEVLL